MSILGLKKTFIHLVNLEYLVYLIMNVYGLWKENLSKWRKPMDTQEEHKMPFKKITSYHGGSHWLTPIILPVCHTHITSCNVLKYYTFPYHCHFFGLEGGGAR